MIVEYIRYALEAHRVADLEEGWRLAGVHLQQAAECLGYDLTRCLDDPGAVIVRIFWVSVDAHLKDFRQGQEFPPFAAVLEPFADGIVEQRHYELTSLTWLRVD